MKSHLFLILLSICLSQAFAQKQLRVKTYQNTDIFKATEVMYTSGFPSSEKDQTFYSLRRISVGVSLLSPKFLHEIEFSFSNNRPPLEHSFDTRLTYKLDHEFYLIQYEIGKYIKTNSKINFSISTGIQGFKQRINYDATIASRFFYYTSNNGLLLNAIPRLSIPLTSKFSFDINLKLALVDFRQTKKRIMNPQIPVEHQINKDHKFIFLPKSYTIRIGFVYNIKDLG